MFDSYIAIGAEGNISNIQAFALTHGTNIPYAIHQEFGTARMPARPILSTIAQSDQFGERLKRALEEWLSDQIKLS